MSFFEVDDLHFAYGPNVPSVLKGVSLQLAAGEIGALLGASGAGKSSLLRCVAGFEKPARGRIAVGGRTLAENHISVPAHQRRIGYLFQNLALFPHLTVSENILYGLHGWSRDRRQSRLQEMLQLTGLGDLQARLPHRLSGGEKQRVALARALAPQPELLLMDEPFSSLDPELRVHLRGEIRQILKNLGTTALIVTHDHDEAYTLADRAGVLRHGELGLWGARDEVFKLESRPVAVLKN